MTVQGWDNVAESTAGLMQFHTKREDLPMVLLKSGHSYVPQVPKHYKAEERGRGNNSYPHPLHHSHHNGFSVEMFQSCPQKFLPSDWSCSEEPITLNTFAHDTCNVCLWSTPMHQLTHGLQENFGREHFIIVK